MEKWNEKQIEILKKHFGVHGNQDDGYEFETWTTGGVNMFVHADNLDDFCGYVDNFDVDDEIDCHRQDERYASAFSIRQSVEDFEGYQEWLEEIRDELKEAK